MYFSFVFVLLFVRWFSALSVRTYISFILVQISPLLYCSNSLFLHVRLFLHTVRIVSWPCIFSVSSTFVQF